MKEEIKEILDDLRYTAKEHTIQVLENGGMIERCPQQIPTEMRLNSYSAKILLDYITNLQEENERLHIQLEDRAYEQIKFLYKDYKSRIYKAIEYIHNHQPVFELSSKEQIQEWFEKEYYVDLLNILQGEDQ